MWKRESSKVLIIEDSSNSNLTLRSILKIGQYTIHSTFSDLRIDEIVLDEPEVIILTLPLQNRNGFEILKTLKRDVKTKHIPVLVITKLNTQMYWDAAYRMGADAYLVTPDHYPYLLNRLNKLRKWNNNIFIENNIAI